jgi:hypothetical protein
MRTFLIWLGLGGGAFGLVNGLIFVCLAPQLARLHERKGWGEPSAWEAVVWRRTGFLVLVGALVLFNAAWVGYRYVKPS